MRTPIWIKIPMFLGVMVLMLCLLTPCVLASGVAEYAFQGGSEVIWGPGGESTPTSRPTTAPTTAPTTKPTTAPTTSPTAAPTVAPTAAPAETQPAETDDRVDKSWLDQKLESLGEQICDGLLGGLSDILLDGLVAWIYRGMLLAAESAVSAITSGSASVFNYSWFQVIVGLFEKFGLLLFGVGMLLAFVDMGIGYHRRGADITGGLLNMGKGLLAVGMFAKLPVPLFNLCVRIQSIITETLSLTFTFDRIKGAFVPSNDDLFIITVMLVIMVVLLFLIFLDSMKRGGILLVQICIGSFYMVSVPRGYLDSFYGWCKQVIALCTTVLLQNLVLFCGLMIVPDNLLLGIGTMFAAKEVPRICAQFGMDTSVKASFSSMAMGANASVQAIKGAVAIATGV